MKILNISTSRLNYNGVGIVLLNYYQNINNPDIILDYLSPDIMDQNFKREITIKGNKAFEFGYKGEKMRQKKPIKYLLKLTKLLKKEKYDIVHIHGSSSMMLLELIAARLSGIKVRIVHSHNTKSDNEKLNNMLKPIFKKNYTHAFACGKEAGEWLFGKNAKFEIIPNGKDCNLYKYDKKTREKYRKANNLENNIIIGHVGNFNNQKNHEYLIKIFFELTKINEKYKLVLIGYGDLLDDIKFQAKKLGVFDKIIFLGQIPVEEVAKWIQAIDIMVFPSRYEGFPNVLIEWQIAGIPCVISDKITKDVKITDLVEFMSIDDEPKNWARQISEIKLPNREKDKECIIKKVSEAGFDIKTNSKKLEKLYLEIYKETR